MKLHKHIFIVLFSLFGVCLDIYTQNIPKAEYFIDSDPGIGNGTSFLMGGVGRNTSLSLPISLEGISPGIHNLSIRVCDSLGNWSINYVRTFVIKADTVPNLKIATAEYFIDADPGINSSQVIDSIIPAKQLLIGDYVNTSHLKGNHIISARVKLENGMWSQTFSKPFNADSGYYIEPIKKLEYFIDKDSGFNTGQLIQDNINSSNFTIGQTIELNNLSEGIHSINVRATTSHGIISATSTKSFYVFSKIQGTIDAVEAFIDNDPGTGKATSINLGTTGQNINNSYVFDLASVNPGIHNIMLRAHNSDGSWSVGASKTFAVVEPSKTGLINMSEIFFDTDPGINKGIPAVISKDSTIINEDINISVTGLSSGNHIVATRVKDTLGNISLASSRAFTICDLIPVAKFSADSVCMGTYMHFTNMSKNADVNTKYYWDLNNDGNNDSIMLQPVYKFVASGIHTVRLIASNGGVCADTIMLPVFVDQPVNPTIIPNGPTTFCDRDSLKLTSQTDFLSYKWSNGATGKEITVYDPGKIFMIGESQFCSNISNEIDITVKPSPLEPVLEIKNGAIYADVKNNIQWYEQLKGKLFGDTLGILIPLTTGNYYTIAKANNGCYSLPSETITFTYDSLDCYTDFSYTIDTNTLTIHFKNLASTSAKAMWNYGDGSYSFEFEGQHQYTKTGRYTICLTVRDTVSGCLKKVCKDVIVGELDCSSVFAYKVNNLTRTVTFVDLSSNTTEWYWSFGDGSLAKTRNAYNTYAKEGVYKVCHWVRNKATNCFDQSCVEIQVGQKDTSIMKAAFTYFAEPGSSKVIFSNKSSASATNFYWTFGDGTFVTDESPVYEYQSEGTYKACLSIFDKSSGKTDQYCEEINVGTPECNISAAFSSIEKEAREVIFYNESLGENNQYYWSFGDGSTSTQKHISHVYDGPGYYLVSLAVKTVNGCYDYASKMIKVGVTSCKSDFTFLVNPTTNNVAFENKSTGNISNYFWYFGDGEYSVEENPAKFFENDGMYKVSLTVSNQLKTCMDNYSAFVQVGNIKCDANFNYFIDSTDYSVYFNDKVVGTSTNLLWSFGDGELSSSHNPVHKFEKPGYYKVGLNTFNNQDWCMDYAEETVLVGSAANDCESDFIYQASTSNTSVQFFDKSKGNIIGYIWNFGDGNTNSETNPSYTFNKPGYFNVCHMVINEDLISNIKCKPVIAKADSTVKCLANFDFTVDTFAKKAYLVDKSEGNPTKWTWDLGNGTTSTTNKVTANYSVPGHYLVDLKIANSNTGCSSRKIKLINIAEPGGLKAGFVYEKSSSPSKAGGYPVDFVGAGDGDQARLRWNFGDGEQDSTTNTPTHNYDNTGTYKVCYEVSDPVTQQTDSVCEMIVIESVGIKEAKKSDYDLKVFPNPVERILTIEYHLSSASKVNIDITDLQGRSIVYLINSLKTAGDYHIDWDAQSLSSGTYLIRIQKGKEENSTRVFIKK